MPEENLTTVLLPAHDGKGMASFALRGVQGSTSFKFSWSQMSSEPPLCP